MIQIGCVGNNAEANRIYSSEGIAKTIKDGGGLGAKTGLYAFSSSQRKTCIESRWKEGEANTLTGNPTSIKSMNVVVHNLQPRSPDRPSLKYSSGGSGHLTKQDGSTYCLDSGNAQAIELQGSIRRLTPRECERLQGFPDDWTLNRLVSLRKDMADNQRYKMLGNAVTTNVVTAIGKRILEAGA